MPSGPLTIAESDLFHSTTRSSHCSRFNQKRMDLLKRESWSDGTLIGLKDDVLAGIATAMVQVPQSIAFAVVGKLNPKFGLFASFYLGLFMGVFGGRGGTIYGAAGALVPEFPHIVEEYGTGGVLACTIGCGIVCVLPGIFNVCDLIRMMPNSVMVGFVDGLAAIIFRGSLENFTDPNGDYITGMRAFYTVLIAFVTLAVQWIPTLVATLVPAAASIIDVVPWTILSVIIGTAVEYIFGLGTYTVGDKYTIAGTLEAPALPELANGKTWNESIGPIIGESFVLAAIGLSESLMMFMMMDKAFGTKSSMVRESITYGIANIINGFFGGMAGCMTVGTTILNIANKGGRRRVSGCITALICLAVILAAAPAIEIVPLGAIAGVTFTIVIRSFDWNTFIHFWRLPYSDSCIIVTVAVVAFFTDLAIGAACGIGVALILTAFRMRENVKLTPAHRVVVIPATVGEPHLAHPEYRTITVHVSGTLFFAAAPYFLRDMEHLGLRLRDELKVTDVVLDMEYCDIKDFAAIEAIESVAEYLLKHYHLRTHLVNLERSEAVMRKCKPYLMHVVRSDAKWERRIRAIPVDPSGRTFGLSKELTFPASVAGAHLPVVPAGDDAQPQPLIAAVSFRRCEDLKILLPVGFIACTDSSEPEQNDAVTADAEFGVDTEQDEVLADPAAHIVTAASSDDDDDQGEAVPLVAATNERRLDAGLLPVPAQVALKLPKDIRKSLGDARVDFATAAIAAHFRVEFVEEKQTPENAEADATEMTEAPAVVATNEPLAIEDDKAAMDVADEPTRGEAEPFADGDAAKPDPSAEDGGEAANPDADEPKGPE